MATDDVKIPSKMLILMALPQESQGLIEPWAEQHGINLIFTGMGLINAAIKTTEAMQKFDPEFILNLGTAGSRRFSLGGLVECTEFLRRDQTMGILNKKISVSSFTNLPTGLCGSADFVDTSENLVRFDVVDMEAYAMASVCAQFKKRFASVKYVSDLSDYNVKSQWQENVAKAAQSLHQFLVNFN